YSFLKKKYIFRLYYLTVFLSPLIVSKMIPAIIQSKDYLFLVEFSYKYFGKASIASGREQFWLFVEQLIGESWLLGTGKSIYHIVYPHNLFYSVQYFFGTIGYLLFL